MRAQSALEFLTTYAWAFVIILIMIGALTYYGVTNSQDFIPSRCVIGQDFSCEDYQIASSDPYISLYFGNTGKTITIQGGTFTFETAQATITAANCLIDGVAATSDATLTAGQKVEVLCSQAHNLPTGETQKITFTFEYNKTAGGFNHTVDGEIVAPVQ